MYPIFNYFCAEMVVVAQLVRASDCDSEGRGFEPHHPPVIKSQTYCLGLLFYLIARGYVLV